MLLQHHELTKLKSHKVQELLKQELEVQKVQQHYDSRFLLQITDVEVRLIVLTVDVRTGD